MSQNDFIIADAVGSIVRADINSALQSLASGSSGATAPAMTYPYMIWNDTTNNLLMMRNGADSAWMTLAAFDTTNSRWEPRTNVVQALTTAGIVLKDSTGATVLGVSSGGLTVNKGIFNLNGHQERWSKGADRASAATLTLGTDGNYFDVTGTTTISAISSVGVGAVIKLHFDAALTLTYHATNLILPGGANITTAAGDEAEFVEYAAGQWRCTNYTKADGKPVVSSTVDVGAAMAALPVGAVGTVALLTNYNLTVLTPGATLPGSSLFYANTAEDPAGSWVGSNATSPAGTWRLLGNTGYYNKTTTAVQIAKMTSVWMRIA